MGKKNNINTLLLCSIISLLPTKVYSGPSPETAWLMNEPASLFDLGIVKTKAMLNDGEQNLLSGLKKNSNISILPPSSFVSYDWEQDRIVLSWTKFLKQNEMESLGITPITKSSQTKFNKFCRYMLDSLIGNSFGQKDSWDYFGFRRISNAFGHSDYIKKDMPKELFRNLAQKIVYEVELLIFENEDYPIRPMTCKTNYNNSLKSSEPIFVDYYKEQKLKNKS